ncbi:hypothetical protein PHYSODRAFT_289085 [Phytophthora sojae]|uniref:Uncharacterized protein n=1 Tax=Phytophthora sojae (strain P6497) TaxID=1094619 RepID=G5ADA9_PHYSP|nr:hypothetical protein PHYSODRAFT_289085 [Phytophthora sojae]EGZ06162.1 hypothetical protein PHYSODRAFT_289085 [Phytophthora sojae]|eukprot:XP_009538059.1 hypothetical protein PHYSODRAFT_289085 [Phytophthora sojae]
MRESAKCNARKPQLDDPCTARGAWTMAGAAAHSARGSPIKFNQHRLSLAIRWALSSDAAGFCFSTARCAKCPSDFTKTNRKMFSEWTVLVRHIVAGVEASTGARMQRPTSQRVADDLYQLGNAHVPMKPPTHAAKQRPERAVTTLRRIRQAIHDTLARSIDACSSYLATVPVEDARQWPRSEYCPLVMRILANQTTFVMRVTTRLRDLDTSQ